jgi:2-isopropylmalate synthase
LKVGTQTGDSPTAEVTLWIDGEEKTAFSEGGGVVDATFKAIEKLVNSGASLELYSVSNVTNGTDSLGETTVRMEKAGRIVNGQGADTDIVTASAKAYINALNKLQDAASKAHPQADV